MSFYDPDELNGEVEVNTPEALARLLIQSFSASGKIYIPISFNVLDYEGNLPADYLPIQSYLPDVAISKLATRKLGKDHATALFLAASYHQDNMLSLLLQGGADPNEALWISAVLGKVSFVRQLLQHGANVNERSPDNNTPLFYAAYFGHTDVINVLLSEKARLKKEVISPLFVAAEQGHHEAVKLLIKKGLDHRWYDPAGFRSIHVACYYGHARVVDALMQAGAKINVLSHDGRTPLYIALSRNHIDIAERLLQNKESVKTTIIHAVRSEDTTVLNNLVKIIGNEIYTFIRGTRAAYSPRFFQFKKTENLEVALLSLLSEPPSGPSLRST